MNSLLTEAMNDHAVYDQSCLVWPQDLQESTIISYYIMLEEQQQTIFDDCED